MTRRVTEVTYLLTKATTTGRDEGRFIRRRCCYQVKLSKLEAIHPWKHHEVEERWKYRNQTYFSSEILAGIPRVKKLKAHRIIRNWYIGKRKFN